MESLRQTYFLALTPQGPQHIYIYIYICISTHINTSLDAKRNGSFVHAHDAHFPSAIAAFTMVIQFVALHILCQTCSILALPIYCCAHMTNSTHHIMC